MAFNRSLTPLTFNTSSGVFVGNAGGSGLPRFVVSQQQPPCVSFVTAHICHRLGVKTSVLTSAAGTKLLFFGNSFTRSERRPRVFTSAALSCGTS